MLLKQQINKFGIFFLEIDAHKQKQKHIKNKIK